MTPPSLLLPLPNTSQFLKNNTKGYLTKWARSFSPTQSTRLVPASMLLLYCWPDPSCVNAAPWLIILLVNTGGCCDCDCDCDVSTLMSSIDGLVLRLSILCLNTPLMESFNWPKYGVDASICTPPIHIFTHVLTQQVQVVRTNNNARAH